MGAGNERGRVRRAFTLIELLTVIAIILVVAALAVPNFVSMMKSQKWITATSNIQTMLWRARSLAANTRREAAVEFATHKDNTNDPDNTTLLLESKSGFYEKLPDLGTLQNLVGSGPIFYIVCSGEFYWATGSYGGDAIHYAGGPYFNIDAVWASLHPATQAELAIAQQYYGHNSPQSEANFTFPGNKRVQVTPTICLASGDLAIDETQCVNFINWDDSSSVNYGWDTTNDIRIGTNGALVEPLEPILCIKEHGATDFKKVQVIKCTARVVVVR